MDNYIYKSLNITPIINAAGTYTMVGGSRMSEKTLNDMAEASRAHVDIKELQKKANQKLANLTNNEAACICNGAAAGLYLSAASCVRSKSGQPINNLLFSDLGNYEIIMFSAHRNPYDWSIRQLGVKIKDVGNNNNAHQTTPDELNDAINDRTAGIFYMFSNPGGWISEGGLDLESTINISSKNNIPVIVDAAAQVPPVQNLWEFNRMGAAATLFSGGKDLRGPQSSGFIVGKKDFLNIFGEINFFNYGIGRMLKIGREEIVGLLSAVEQYLEMDHEERNNWVEDQIKMLIEYSKISELFDIVRSFPNEAGQPMARAEIFITNNSATLERISILLKECSPSIFTFVDRGRLFINPMTLFEGETEIIIDKLKEIENKILKGK